MENQTRYTVMYCADQLLLQQDCPVHVKKIQCTRDGLTGRLILQARYVNRSRRTAEALVIHVSLRNEAGREVTSIRNLRMTGFCARAHSCFGDEKTIILPQEFASVQIIVEQVGFTDGFRWIRRPESLPISIEPPVRIGGRIQPAHFNGYWYCSCGMVNPDTLAQCSYCCRPSPQLTADTLASQLTQTSAEGQGAAPSTPRKVEEPASSVPEPAVSEKEAMEAFPDFAVSPKLERAVHKPRRWWIWLVLAALAIAVVAALILQGSAE